MTAISYRYRAFLSYSHRDTQWARWLHKALEGQRIDREMVGRATQIGPVPKTLRPIFRDREDFAAGHSLTEQTTVALEASQFLVVLCSPNAAKSPYVNEEIRFFKALGRADRVIPIIIDGEPAEGENDCFPPALRFRVGDDGQLTSEREEPIAADARPQGDGREVAKRKLIAGLLGVGLDEIERRAERARRRRNRVLGAVAGSFMLLALLASGSAAYAWQQLKTNEAFLNATLITATQIVDTAVEQAERYNMPRTATLEVLGRAEGLFDDMARLGRATPELRYRKAEMLIAFARNYRILGKSDRQLERATQAHRLLAELAAERLDDETYQRGVGTALNEVASVLAAQGHLVEALQAYNETLTIRLRAVTRNPRSDRVWGDVVLVRVMIGDILMLQGQSDAAFAEFNDARRMARVLVIQDPTQTLWKTYLATASERVGSILLAKGKLAEALEARRAALAIREKIALNEPQNWEAQRNRLVSHSNVGEVLIAMGDFAGALETFSAALTLAQRLAANDPANATGRSDLASSHERLGFALQALDQRDEALVSYRAALVEFERLVQVDPRNMDWRRGMATQHQRIGVILQVKNDLTGALAEFERSLEEAKPLLATDASNTVWQRDLAVLLRLIADVRSAQHAFAPAIEGYRAALAIFTKLSSTDPGNPGWTKNFQVLAEGLSSTGYQCILHREFSLALQATEESLAAAPQVLWLQLNHAHALMFAGRVDEARALYLKHRGVPDAQDGKSWNAVVLGDFAELRQAGLTHPLMEEIERAFATAG